MIKMWLVNAKGRVETFTFLLISAHLDLARHFVFTHVSLSDVKIEAIRQKRKISVSQKYSNLTPV